MTHLTTLDELHQQITLLASVDESDAPFISAYLNLERGQAVWRETLDERARILRGILKGDDLADLEDALVKIEAWLSADLLPEAKGAAIFVRGIFGGAFMLPMQFATPLPNWIAVYPTPNIYHLVELKDNYHRYIILLAMPEQASILENLRRVLEIQASQSIKSGSNLSTDQTLPIPTAGSDKTRGTAVSRKALQACRVMRQLDRRESMYHAYQLMS